MRPLAKVFYGIVKDYFVSIATMDSDRYLMTVLTKINNLLLYQYPHCLTMALSIHAISTLDF